MAPVFASFEFAAGSATSAAASRHSVPIIFPPSLSSQLPPLRSSFPPSLHPLHLTVQTLCEPWILRVAEPSTASYRQFLLDCLLPRYVCRLFPNSPHLPRLCNMTKIISWFTLADDVADSLSTSEEAIDWSSRVLRVMEAPHAHSQSHHQLQDPAAARLLDALAHVWGDISPHMPGDTRDRFLRSARHHLDAVCLQSHIRSSPSPAELTTSQYMDMRRLASGFPMGLELAPYALSFDRDLHVLHHPLVSELLSLTIDYMCVCNDVLSCRVEIEKGDYVNLPCVLYRFGSVSSLQEAVECTCEIAKGIDERSVEVVQQIHQNAELMGRSRSMVEAYVQMLVSCMAGTIEWSYESVRYGLRAAIRSGGDAVVNAAGSPSSL